MSVEKADLPQGTLGMFILKVEGESRDRLALAMAMAKVRRAA